MAQAKALVWGVSVRSARRSQFRLARGLVSVSGLMACPVYRPFEASVAILQDSLW